MIGAHYRVGTVTVTYGETDVDGALTAWTAEAREGDTFVGPDGREYEIAVTPTVNTLLTLRTAYRGSSTADAPYAIKRYSRNWSTVATLAAKIANFLQSVVVVLSGVGAPDNSSGGEGSIYFDLDEDDPRLHRKSGGAYDAGIPLKGPPGPQGPGISTTSVTTHTIGTGNKTFTVPVDGAAYQGARLRVAMRTTPSNYMEGVVDSSTSVSVTINMAKTNGSGTSSDWVLVATGDPGSQGLPGSPSTGVSSSTNTIGTGSKTFAVTAGLDLIAGQRVRFAEAVDPVGRWMDGTITAYAGGSMTISVASDGISTSGSGSYSSWTFGVIGARGLTGATGSTGAASTVPGPSYNATSTSSVAIGTGNKTFAIGTNTAYLPGARVRVASTATPSTHWMEGECITYAAGDITIAVETVGTGTGTLASWNLNLAGERGQPGVDGFTFNFRGSYSAGTAYAVNDVVTDQNSTWINTSASTGVAPPTLPTTSNANWTAIAVAGIDGSGAVNSVNGEAGDVILTAADIEAEHVPTSYLIAGASLNDHLIGIDDAIAAGQNFALTTIASAATVDIGNAATTAVLITGTTTITSLGTAASKARSVRFGGVLTLTHNATTLVLPGSANISTAAGDVAEFLSDASGNWRCTSYTRGNQPPVTADGKLTLNRASASAESFEFLARTSIGYPVPFLRPTTANTRCAFDLSPNGAPSVGSGLVTWVDVCNADITATPNLGCARVGVTVDKVVFGSVKYGTVGDLPVEIQVGGTDVARFVANALLVGKSTSNVGTVGCEFSTLGIFYAIADGATPALFNRLTNDGNLLTWRRDATNIGFVSCASGVVTYGSFCGGHWSQFEAMPSEILPGTILDSVDQMCTWDDEADAHLPKCRISNEAGSRSVYGVFQNYDEDGDVVVASLGALFVRMRAGVTVRRGDLIESAGDGTGRVQRDGVIRSSTVAKVTSAKVLTTYTDGSFTVPCTLHCG